MDTSAGVLRRSITGTVAGKPTNPFHHKSKYSCPCSRSSTVSLCKQEFGVGSNLKSRRSNLQKSRELMVYDEGYLEYYSSGRGKIRCGKKEKSKENDVVLKKTKKKLKFLKGLTRNLSNLTDMGIGFGFGFGSDVGLVDQVQGKTISEATELLLGQLQQLKAEEKELKRKRKEEKALMKMQRASPQVQGAMKCEMSSSSSSSSSSDSSGDECENLVDMKNLNCKTLAQTIPEACERALEDAPSTMPQTQIAEVDASIETSSALSMPPASLEVPFPANVEQKEGCSLEASDYHIGNIGSTVTLGNSNATVAATTTATGTKKIEVCMGGKCKKSGAAAILEKFQQVAGIEAAVSGCKCMGKCKVGPNVKVSGCSAISPDAFQAGDSVSVGSSPSSTNSLCIGVGLEDVNMIAANLLGRFEEVGLANAAC